MTAPARVHRTSTDVPIVGVEPIVGAKRFVCVDLASLCGTNSTQGAMQ